MDVSYSFKPGHRFLFKLFTVSLFLGSNKNWTLYMHTYIIAKRDWQFDNRSQYWSILTSKLPEIYIKMFASISYTFKRDVQTKMDGGWDSCT